MVVMAILGNDGFNSVVWYMIIDFNSFIIEGRGREGVGGGKGNFPLSSVGSEEGRARPTAIATSTGSRVSESLPLCVCYSFELFHAF